jgi:hypothetical protein
MQAYLRVHGDMLSQSGANSYMLSGKHGGTRMPKRRLGSDERRQIAEKRRLKEIDAHPDGTPVVTVEHVGESAKDRKDRNAKRS